MSVIHEPFSHLEFIGELPIKMLFRDLVYRGCLNYESIPRLKNRLISAQRQPKPNPKLMGTFVLYLQGHSRREIASALHCSESLVRCYINEIYQIFQLELEQFDGTVARRRRLYDVARSEGLL